MGGGGVRVRVRVGVQGKNRIPITTPNTSPSLCGGRHSRYPIGRRVARRGGVFAAADSGSRRQRHQCGYRPGRCLLGSGHRPGSGHRLLNCCCLHRCLVWVGERSRVVSCRVLLVLFSSVGVVGGWRVVKL